MAKRRCAHKPCRRYFDPGAGINNGVNAWCSDECQYRHAMAAAQKLRDQKARDDRKRERAERVKSRKQRNEFYANDRNHQYRLTLEAAKKLCRVLDAGKPCISCGTTADVQYAAGHYITVGANRGLGLDLRNIHRQCNRYCNCGLSGNIAGTPNTFGYRAGLVDRYGYGLVAWLDGFHPPRKLDCDSLIAMRKEYLAEIRRIEKGEAPSRNWRALPAAERAA